MIGGWYIQAGKKKLMDIDTFTIDRNTGRIEGSGNDAEGNWVISGDFDLQTGKCKLDKEYNDGEWTINYGGYLDDV